MEAVKAVINGAAFLAGLLILFYTLFSYEDEEKRVKSWFETAWIALQAGDAGIGARLGAFLRKLLTGLERVFNRLYGAQLLSLRVFAVATCLAATAYILMGTLYVGPSLEQGAEVIVIVLAIGCIPALATLLRRNWPSYLVSSLIYFIMIPFVLHQSQASLVGTGFLLISFIAEDFLIAAIRQLFLLAERPQPLRRTLILIFTGSFIAPTYLLFLRYGGRFLTGYESFQNLPSFLFAYNVIPFLTSLSFLFVLFVAVTLRIIYAMLPRAVYVPVKLKLLDNRKAAAGLGIALMGVSIPSAMGFLKEAAKVIGLA